MIDVLPSTSDWPALVFPIHHHHHDHMLDPTAWAYFWVGLIAAIATNLSVGFSATVASVSWRRDKQRDKREDDRGRREEDRDKTEDAREGGRTPAIGMPGEA